MLRSAALNAVKYCGIVGECNIQFGLDPKSNEYCAIEINARLSRSSSLASKATGYPPAYMAAKIGLGYSLDELVNKVTKITTACFEPSLDYVVLKMPRWDFKKFEMVNRKIGTTMKSVGEVMAIGRNFEEVLQKAIRMSDTGKEGLVSNINNISKDKDDKGIRDIESIEQTLIYPDDNIIFDVVDAFRAGLSIEKIYELSYIDPWFLKKIKNIYSKGGMLSLLIASQDPSVKAVVAYYPLTDFEEWLDLSRYSFPKSLWFYGIRSYVLKELQVPTWEEALKTLRVASPIHQAERIQAPLLLIHGEKDLTAPLSQVQRLCRRMQDAGRNCELFIIPRAGHVFNFLNEEQGKEAWRKTMNFLDSQLKEKKVG